MIVRRGDVVLAWYPFSTGVGGKRRPVLVVQNDTDNVRISNTIVAQITSNLDRAGTPTHLLIEVGSSAGIQSGLLHDSVVSGRPWPYHDSQPHFRRSRLSNLLWFNCSRYLGVDEIEPKRDPLRLVESAPVCVSSLS